MVLGCMYRSGDAGNEGARRLRECRFRFDSRHEEILVGSPEMGVAHYRDVIEVACGVIITWDRNSIRNIQMKYIRNIFPVSQHQIQ